MPDNANRNYFWRVYESKTKKEEEKDDFFYVDGFNLDKANWMRFVNAAFSVESQNLVACQVGMSIYFYTIKDIEKGQELLVWYSRDFARRLSYPLSGELMVQALKQQSQLSPSQRLTPTDDGYHSNGGPSSDSI